MAKEIPNPAVQAEGLLLIYLFSLSIVYNSNGSAGAVLEQV